MTRRKLFKFVTACMTAPFAPAINDQKIPRLRLTNELIRIYPYQPTGTNTYSLGNEIYTYTTSPAYDFSMGEWHERIHQDAPARSNQHAR